MGRSKGDSLVLIRDGGDRPPLFLVHDGDGETMLYRNLAFRIKGDHAIYGLRPIPDPMRPMAHTRIAEMAAHYIDKMRSVQPHGPYFVGGMCAGGVIAFEVALQLQAMGEKVGMVALIDAADVEARPKAWHFFGRRLQNFSSTMLQGRSARFDRRALSMVIGSIRKATNLGKYLVADRLQKLSE